MTTTETEQHASPVDNLREVVAASRVQDPTDRVVRIHVGYHKSGRTGVVRLQFAELTHGDLRELLGLLEQREVVQRNTVVALNDCSNHLIHYTVDAGEHAEYAREMCSNDEGHGLGTVCLPLLGDETEQQVVCPSCAIQYVTDSTEANETIALDVLL